MSGNEEQVVTQEIIITPEAAAEIKKIREANKVPDSHALRMGVRSGGCCGLSYLLAFDEKAEETDKILQSEGITVYVDAQSFAQLAGTTLQYVNGSQGSGFKFENPNDQNSCDCGDDGCCE
jgi:iron-sulfur cluster assembly accessory protein